MSDRLFISTRKGLFTLARSSDRRRRWTIAATAFLGDPINLTTHDRRDGAIYSVLNLGHFGNKLRRSDDDGATWQELLTPSYPEDATLYANNFAPPTDARSKSRPAVLNEIWSLEPGGADEPSTLWAGTIPGGLFRSDDRGASWRLVRELWDAPERAQWFGGGKDEPGIHSICVDPRDSRHVTVGISCGGVWTTRDGGSSWTCVAHGMRAAFMPPELADNPNIQDPHRVVQCAGAPDHYWAQHHNGIFRSTNDCRRWEEIENASPSNFGFAVAVHPNDPLTAWFVPGVKDERRIPVEAKFVATRTRDGGQSFETLTRGLPQEHAYDLVYRHALDVDDSGSRLAMGSTTGGLWTSEDGGDSWEALDARLPPVYAVRFG